MPVDSALLAELGRATWAITLPNLSRVPARLAAPGADLFRLGLVQVLDVSDGALALADSRGAPAECLGRLGRGRLDLNLVQLLLHEGHGFYSRGG